jgi:transglutaminase-like putative cysteine protease
MTFGIRHTTRYTYSKPVFLEPHVLRLRPRSDAAQRLVQFDLLVFPEPTGRSECLDLDGNCVCQLWFNFVTDHLEIRTASVVETIRTNPFDFLITPETGLTLPMRYPAMLVPSLRPYLEGQPSVPDDVAKFGTELAQAVGWETLPFLSTLTARLPQHCTVVIREEGDPLPPDVVLAQRQGSCRDLALLFIDACRAVGLAARFVSGYQEGDPDQSRRDLHAWAEVYLPGGGWRGYDPTLGLVVADRHIALAAGPTFRDVSPVTGIFRGTGATATLQANITINVMCEPPRE